MKDELRLLARELLSRAKAAPDDDWKFGKFGDTLKSGDTLDAPVPASGPAAALAAIAAEVEACRKCPLGSQRLRAVPGVGSPSARVMFVGEGPGYEEDRKGEPFVGKAGQLLDKMLASIGLSRRTVFIANIVKCHPMTDPAHPELRGNDRPPTPQEVAACRAYLDRQIESIGPKAIVTLGAVATRVLLDTSQGITALRGKWREYVPGLMGARPIRLLPTYHPAALLRDESLKRDAWKDLKALLAELESPS